MKLLKSYTSLTGMIAGIGFLVAPPCASAQLPAANISEGYTVGIGNGEIVDNTSTAGPLSYSGSTTYASTSLSLLGSNNPSPNFAVSGTLTFTPNPDEDTDVASIGITDTYSMEINGPQPTVSVLVNAEGDVSLDKTVAFSGGDSGVLFTVRTGFGPFTVNDSIQAGPSALVTSDSFDEDNVYTFDTGKIYTIEANAGISLVGPSGISDIVTGNASIDPTFGIASSVSDPSDYTFEFSSGIGNTPLGGGGGSSVPDEASTLGLLACVTIGLIAWSRGNYRPLCDRAG